jgi:hypothetical protein
MQLCQWPTELILEGEHYDFLEAVNLETKRKDYTILRRKKSQTTIVVWLFLFNLNSLRNIKVFMCLKRHSPFWVTHNIIHNKRRHFFLLTPFRLEK